MMTMPRVRCCWHCNKQLRGRSYATRVIDGEERILHKFCALVVDNPIFQPVSEDPAENSGEYFGTIGDYADEEWSDDE